MYHIKGQLSIIAESSRKYQDMNCFSAVDLKLHFDD